MTNYYKTSESIVDFNNNIEVSDNYEKGFVFTRLGKGVMNQTRSLRIDLAKFDLNSENRRVLRKTEGLDFDFKKLPLADYSWEIHKLGKDFYSTKFGDNTMSASKIKEMFNDMDKSNMNSVFEYSFGGKVVGYCLCYENDNLIHYAYPFYELQTTNHKLPTTNYELPSNLGLGMMLCAIIFAKENGKSHIYLGSITDNKAKYKLQFEGLEWWDGNNWSSDLSNLKNLL